MNTRFNIYSLPTIPQRWGTQPMNPRFTAPDVSLLYTGFLAPCQMNPEFYCNQCTPQSIGSSYRGNPSHFNVMVQMNEVAGHNVPISSANCVLNNVSSNIASMNISTHSATNACLNVGRNATVRSTNNNPVASLSNDMTNNNPSNNNAGHNNAKQIPLNVFRAAPPINPTHANGLERDANVNRQHTSNMNQSAAANVQDSRNTGGVKTTMPLGINIIVQNVNEPNIVSDCANNQTNKRNLAQDHVINSTTVDDPVRRSNNNTDNNNVNNTTMQQLVPRERVNQLVFRPNISTEGGPRDPMMANDLTDKPLFGIRVSLKNIDELNSERAGNGGTNAITYNNGIHVVPSINVTERTNGTTANNSGDQSLVLAQSSHSVNCTNNAVNNAVGGQNPRSVKLVLEIDTIMKMVENNRKRQISQTRNDGSNPELELNDDGPRTKQSK